MALTSAPYGLVPINLLGGQGFAGSTRLYSIPSGYAVNIQTGDPVIITNTGSTRGTIARMNATATATTVTSTGGGFGFVGVFVGCTYTDPVFGKIFRQMAMPLLMWLCVSILTSIVQVIPALPVRLRRKEG